MVHGSESMDGIKGSAIGFKPYEEFIRRESRYARLTMRSLMADTKPSAGITTKTLMARLDLCIALGIAGTIARDVVGSD